MFDRLKERGQANGGLIKTIFVAMILLVVMGWVVNTVVGVIPDNGDNLGVIDAINTYGPTIVNILFIGLFILGVSALIQYLRM